MRPYSLSHLSNGALIRDLKSLVARDRATTAALLAHIAEVDHRRLYAGAGYSSMFTYCVEELRLSEDAAYKRILAARTGRKYPVVFTLLAEGRLHLTAVRLLAPHLTPENAEELLGVAIGARASEIEAILVGRFGKPDEPTRIRVVASPLPAAQVTLEQGIEADISTPSELVSRPVETLLALPAAPAPAPAPPAPRYRLEVTLDQATHDKLRQVQALLGPTVPSGDVARVLDRALDALLARLEKRKFAATAQPQATAAAAPAGGRTRRIPAGVRRAVWQRDGGECTFVGERGRCCHARRFLEFDHIEPVARGSVTTVENLRLRCRAHNQLEAARSFGTGFMEGKRTVGRASRQSDGATTPSPGTRTPNGPMTARKEPLRVRDDAT